MIVTVVILPDANTSLKMLAMTGRNAISIKMMISMIIRTHSLRLEKLSRLKHER